jgi:response regulator NasT
MTEIFEAEGIRVSAACGSGAEILRWCGRMSGGVILTGYKLYDMTAQELFEDLPQGFSMLLLGTQMQLEDCLNEEICRICAPAARSDLVASIRMLLGQLEGEAPVPTRTSEDKALITRAKELLMSRNHMTEEQAHRFLQKRSMDAGRKMVETAMEVLDGVLMI